MSLLGLGNKEVGIDLGTSNIQVAIKGKGIVLREPTVVAIDRRTEKIVATGKEAKEMLGRTPEAIKAIHPLKDGVIADLTATKLMLRNIMKKISKKYNVGKPVVVVGVPYGITEVEERAVEEAIIYAGAKEVYVMEEPMAAAIGSGIHVEEPTGSMIIDIGGGTTEVAVVSLGGIVVTQSVRIAGDELDEDIVDYIKRKQNLSIGKATAEEIKMQIGCAISPISVESMEIRGRDLNTGLPRNITINSNQILEALEESILKIIYAVKQALEKTPPELSADLVDRGIVLTGGGALIQNLDQLLSKHTNMVVYVSDEPLDSVIRGIEKTLDELKKVKPALINRRKKGY